MYYLNRKDAEIRTSFRQQAVNPEADSESCYCFQKENEYSLSSKAKKEILMMISKTSGCLTAYIHIVYWPIIFAVSKYNPMV